MFVASLLAAREKAASENEVRALAPVLDAARALDEADRTYAARLAGRRREQGRKAQTLSRGTKAALQKFAADEADITRQMLRDFESLETASIVRVLQVALQADIGNATRMLEQYPEPDRPLGEELVNLKQSLLAELSGFLAQYPPRDAG